MLCRCVQGSFEVAARVHWSTWGGQHKSRSNIRFACGVHAGMRSFYVFLPTSTVLGTYGVFSREAPAGGPETHLHRSTIGFLSVRREGGGRSGLGLGLGTSDWSSCIALGPLELKGSEGTVPFRVDAGNLQ